MEKEKKEKTSFRKGGTYRRTVIDSGGEGETVIQRREDSAVVTNNKGTFHRSQETSKKRFPLTPVVYPVQRKRSRKINSIGGS